MIDLTISGALADRLAKKHHPFYFFVSELLVAKLASAPIRLEELVSEPAASGVCFGASMTPWIYQSRRDQFRVQILSHLAQFAFCNSKNKTIGVVVRSSLARRVATSSFNYDHIVLSNEVMISRTRAVISQYCRQS